MERENILEIKDLDVRLFTERGELPVIDRLNLTLRAGETLGIVGESGCGKSMLASAIMGLVARPGTQKDSRNRNFDDLSGADDEFESADELWSSDCGDDRCT